MKKSPTRSVAKKAARSANAVAKKNGKIVATKASASVIRQSLGIKKADVRVGLAVLRLARAKSPKRPSPTSSSGSGSKTAAR